MAIWVKRLTISAILVAIATAAYWALQPGPVSVDVAPVISGPMEVTIQEEGVTRVKEVYTLSSPITGYLDRTTLDAGERVRANITAVATIHPLDPPFLDERTRRELASAIEASRSAVQMAEVQQNREKVALKLRQSEFDRTEKLAKKRIVPLSQLETAHNALALQKAQVASAGAALKLRRAELATARVRLQQPREAGDPQDTKSCCIRLTAPVDGVVLNILVRSEQAVSPGTRIAEIGNVGELEIVVDLLSRDAVRIKPGSAVKITDWGGAEVLHGKVRTIEPAAFTKVSSLGIEEQRVNVVIDLDSWPSGFGHGYRVLVHLVVWAQEEVVQIPVSALFRSSGQWSVFLWSDGVASQRVVEIDHMNSDMAQVVSGVDMNNEVILFPSDTIEDGTAVKLRQSDR
ncbi:MAG: efflux RND transporter periplasmic adaptor subunit [Rhizobiaceae bacterium]